ncbi:hypothetical protein ACFB49_21590 [Sphingomonas sp. DBB INV C78]|uniref:hypothetical protein n=1 Tax=Sphingomonas sp. DBB INV C78 TaxID=3349434 RepID=UPI0036D2750B
MRVSAIAALLLLGVTPVMAHAQASSTAVSSAKFSTSETEFGDILDDPAAKAIVEKHIPGMTTSDQVDMARAMTLKAIQQYAPDEVTDARLAAIDADFAKLGK